jgi:HPt (histidine-containing phosphotransfer) domain-containing protein
MNGSQTDTIRAAFADTWARSLPLINQRVAAVEQAAIEMKRPSPDSDRIELGRAEAHKLAGVLGTFGLQRGTELARDLEEHLICPPEIEEAGRLKKVAAELRTAVEDASAP